MRILILLLTFPTLFFGQLSPKVNAFYQQLSKSKRAESKNIGYSGSESELYKIHSEMGKIATDKEVEYIAFNGNAVTKFYATNILFDRKSIFLEKLFDFYVKNNDLIDVLGGCITNRSHLADELYEKVAFEKENIKQAKWERKWKDSMIINKKENTPEYLNMVDMLTTETKWANKEIDSLIYNFDQIVLNNQQSPQNIVEMVCTYHLYENVKIPYHEKLVYFEKKYNSEYIRKYLEFSSN